MDTHEVRKLYHTILEGPGGHCPVCDRWGKISPITMTGTIVRSLIWLRNEHLKGDTWVHVPSTAPRYVMRSYSISSAKHWGLVQQRKDVPEPKEEGKPKTKYSGYWRLTEVGADFLNGHCRMPKKVYIYNDTRQGVSPEEVYARDCLSKNFDYNALMGDSFQNAVAP